MIWSDSGLDLSAASEFSLGGWVIKWLESIWRFRPHVTIFVYPGSHICDSSFQKYSTKMLRIGFSIPCLFLRLSLGQMIQLNFTTPMTASRLIIAPNSHSEWFSQTVITILERAVENGNFVCAYCGCVRCRLDAGSAAARSARRWESKTQGPSSLAVSV